MLTQYFKHLQAIGRSAKTIKWYEHKWRQFLAYVTEHEASHITPDVVQDFFIYRQGVVTINTVQGDFSALHAGFTWALEHGFIERNPMEHLHKPKAPLKQIEIFTPDEFRAMLKFVNNRPDSSDFTKARDYALLLFLYDTGIRESELVDMTVRGLDLTGHRVKVMGKGSKERVVPFGERTRLSYESFASKRNGSPYAFPNNTGGHLSAHRAYDIIQETCVGAGIPRRKLHALRHTFACNYLDAGGNDIDLMYLLGHSSLAMVNHYAQWTRAQRAIRKHSTLSPADRL